MCSIRCGREAASSPFTDWWKLSAGPEQEGAGGAWCISESCFLPVMTSGAYWKFIPGQTWPPGDVRLEHNGGLAAPWVPVLLRFRVWVWCGMCCQGGVGQRRCDWPCSAPSAVLLALRVLSGLAMFIVPPPPTPSRA